MPPSDPTPTLIEFCEPFFLQVGNVLSSVNYTPDSAYEVRNLLKAELDKLHRKAASRDESRGFSDDYNKIEPILAFFADGIIIHSTLPFADKWRDNMLLASDPRIGGIVDGMRRFFLDLDATLREGAAAQQRLVIFQTCLGLGFGGVHKDDPNRLKQYSNSILRQINLNSEARAGLEIGSGHKQRIQNEVICQPVMERLMTMGIVGGALALATIVSYIWICISTRGEIYETLGRIINP